MRAVLFDLDGTLADTEILKAKSLALAVRHFGGNSTPEIYKKVMGNSWEVVTNEFFSSAKIKVDIDDFNAVFRKHYVELINSELADNRAALKFVRLLKQRNLSVGVVSSASPWMMQNVLQKLKLENTFDVVISNADTKNHKPNPEAYLLALKKLQLSAKDAIAFEDSESGFLAATSAEVAVYGFRHEYNQGHSFKLCKETIASFEPCIDWPEFKS